MKRTELNLLDLKDLILSPGNIFWKQRSGNLIPISSKANFLNHALLVKLTKSNSELLIDSQLDQEIQAEFLNCFEHHKAELLVKNKLPWRQALYSQFKSFSENSDLTQFEVTQLIWRVFSRVDSKKAQELLDEDLEFFKRALNIASSYTVCAFMLGYYHDEFLSKLFTDTFLNLMDLNSSIPAHLLKEQLEVIRAKGTWESTDFAVIKNVYQLDKKQNLLLGERLDGTGINSINQFEMTDLEKLLIALNDHYAFSEHSGKNIFYEIQHSNFLCEPKVLNILVKCLKKNEEVAPKEVSA